MAASLLLRDGLAEPIRRSDGSTFGVRFADDGLTLGPVCLTYGPIGPSGLPVTVFLPPSASQAEILSLDGQRLLLPAGSSNVLASDLTGAPDPTVVQTFIRAVGADGALGRWSRRNLIFAAPAPVVEPPSEITVDGVPVIISLSDIEGAPLTVAWPVPSRPDPSEQRLIRVYAAATGGSPTSTPAFAGVVPAVAPSWIAPTYRIFNSVQNEWIEIEAAERMQVEEAVEAGPIDAGDVSWVSTWLPGLRQLFTATVDVDGVGRADELQARIVTERHTTVWADCALAAADPSTVRNLPTGVLRPTGQPGEGYDVFEMDDGEDRFSIQLRKRLNGEVDWSDPSELLTAPLPAGSIQPNATATTAAELRAAMIAGAATTGYYLIHVTANIVMPSNTATTLHFTNLTKTGREMVITSPNRAAPARIRGVTGRLFYLTNCRNIVLDRLDLWNDKTTSSGGTQGVPVMQIPAGTGVEINGGSRIHIRSCLIRHWNVGLYVRNYSFVALEWCEISETGQDGCRMYWQGSNLLRNANHIHSPIINNALTKVDLDNQYHPDNHQGATSLTQARGGHKNLRFIRERVYGFEGYFSGFLLGNQSVEQNLANLATDAYEDIEFRDCYIEIGHANGIWTSATRRVRLRNIVIRKWPAGEATPSFGWRVHTEDCEMSDCVSPLAVQWITRYGGMSAAQLQAGVARTNVVTSNTAWPATWPDPGGDRAAAYPTGPDAYR